MAHAQYAISVSEEAAAAADVIQCDVSGKMFCQKVARRISVIPAVLSVSVAQRVLVQAMFVN